VDNNETRKVLFVNLCLFDM